MWLAGTSPVGRAMADDFGAAKAQGWYTGPLGDYLDGLASLNIWTPVMMRRPKQVDFDIVLFPRIAQAEDFAAYASMKVRFKLADGVRRSVYELDRLADWLERPR